MSETVETVPQDGGAPPPEPAATPAPVTPEGAAPEPPEETPEPAKASRTERRIAALSARLSAGEAERQRMAAELEQYRRQAPPPQPDRPLTPEDIPRLVEERVAAELEQRLARERADRFHEQGRSAYPDWADKCQSLISMGADAQFAQLLIETPDGQRIAAALADDPEQMEQIAGLKTERARAIALGRYAAALADKPVTPARSVSRAPPPIRPVTGTAKTEFNEYTETDANKLADYYARQAMERRLGRR